MEKNLNIAYLNGAEGITRKSSTSSSGYCIPIVDSKDKLEGLGLKQGQIAAVAANAVQTSFSELYQPIIGFTATKPSDFDNWDKVTAITCEIPYDISDTSYSAIGIVSRTFYENQSDASMYYLNVIYYDGMPHINVYNLITDETIEFLTITNGKLEINQSLVDEFNTILSNGDFVYAGLVEGDFFDFDLGFKVINDNLAELYINNGNLFEKIVSKKQLETKASKIIQERNNMSFMLIEETLPDNNSTEVAINTDYTVFKMRGGVGVGVFQLPTINKDEIHEYIIEYHCLGSPFYFKQDLNIVWENDTPPAFEPNTIVRISIINGLATYKVFPMST